SEHDLHATQCGRRAGNEGRGPGDTTIGGTDQPSAGGGIDDRGTGGAESEVVDRVEICRIGELAPGAAAVSRLEDAGAAELVDVEVTLAGAGVDHHRVARVDQQAGNRHVGHEV